MMAEKTWSKLHAFWKGMLLDGFQELISEVRSAFLVYFSFFFLQLPHGLPSTSLNLETEVEKRFLRDPAWLPVHDTDFAFQKFLEYVTPFIVL